MTLTPLLKQKALETGFDLAGIAPLGVWKDLDYARKWVEQGFGGEMRYLENPKRHDPRLVLPSAKSVLCVGLIYNAPLPYSTEAASVSAPEGTKRLTGPSGKEPLPRGWISRYAWGKDYHQTMRARLEKLRKAIESLAHDVETRVYVDTGPVVERAFARHSGIGWTGKNTCLINPAKGSWFFLGVILASLEIEPDLPAPDRCGSCTRCLDACPTGALTQPYVMDASRCIAYLNIELKGSIPERYREQIGANLFGCDICQDVCPWNRSRQSAISNQLAAVSSQGPQKGFGRTGAATTRLPEFQPMDVTLSGPADAGDSGSGEGTDPLPAHRFSLFNPPLDMLTKISEEDFRRAFAQSPIKRPKYRGWLRNLCVVMGNSGDRRFIPKLEELARHEDPVIREHAEWALARLTVGGGETKDE
jgi:epoxyqueuosine reductase